MLTRRTFISGAVLAGAASALAGCAGSAGETAYERSVRAIWNPPDDGGGEGGLTRDLVRYAILAPSSHNSQCWKFRLREKSVTILPDPDRRLPEVDPDDHHLFVSLGCAAENLVQAAAARGHAASVQFIAGAGGAVAIDLAPGKAVPRTLFEAITRRQSSRTEFNGQVLSNAELKLLQNAGTGNGVRVLLLTARPVMENVLEYVIQGNSAQMRDPAFVAELKAWIRFGETDALRSADGLFSITSGNPALPHWLGSRLFPLLFRENSENEKYARHIRSSAGIAVFVSEVNDKAHWVEAGRAFERFALQATVMGVRTAHLNQPVEVAALRPQFASFLGIGAARPDLVVRFGRGPQMPRSLRRPVDAVILV